MATNIFELATRKKIRFTSPRGELSTEQLWDVPLKAGDGFNLDTIAKAANRVLVALKEESFVSTERTPAHEKAELTLDIVKHVIAVKLAEEEAARKRSANRAEKERLYAILAEKEAGALTALSVKELQDKIDALKD
jgi:hypothetical protein